MCLVNSAVIVVVPAASAESDAQRLEPPRCRVEDNVQVLVVEYG